MSDDNVKYKVWMESVDKTLARKCEGMTSEDLPDYCWFDLYDSAMTPGEAVEEYLQDDRYGPYG